MKLEKEARRNLDIIIATLWTAIIILLAAAIGYWLGRLASG